MIKFNASPEAYRKYLLGLEGISTSDFTGYFKDGERHTVFIVRDKHDNRFGTDIIGELTDKKLNVFINSLVEAVIEKAKEEAVEDKEEVAPVLQQLLIPSSSQELS